DTNTSNLKNNYGEVKIWNFLQKDFLPTGKQFCGLMMGDFSKAGINTMFNTGTVVGVSANVFGGGFPPKYIPSFAWGGANSFEIFDFEKSLEVANRMMQRRNQKLSEAEIAILKHVFDSKES
ncbi:MAG: glucose-1-phosphate thymidylyltransferase, partial [Raineya sp.]